MASETPTVQAPTPAQGSGRARPDLPPGPRPWTVPAAAVGAIAVMFGLVLLIDVGGAFGGIPAMHDMGLAPPAVWFQMFQDRGVAEFAQWALYGWFVILAARLRGRALDADRQRLWGLVAVFGVLLLLEDAGGVRDTLTHWGDVFLPGSSGGLIAIFTWFGAIAAVLGWAVLRYGRDVVTEKGVWGYGVAGVLAFALASLGEAVEHVVGWMGTAGWWLVNRVLGAPHILELPQHDVDYLVYLFADFVIEEPLELLGIALLIAAVLTHVRSLRPPLAEVDR